MGFNDIPLTKFCLNILRWLDVCLLLFMRVLLEIEQMKAKVSEVSAESEPVIEDCNPDFLPNLRSGACADIGFRSSMEDVYLCVDNFLPNFGPKNHIDGPSAFYGVILWHIKDLAHGNDCSACGVYELQVLL